MLSQAINRYLLPRCMNWDPNPFFSSSTGMLWSQRGLGGWLNHSVFSSNGERSEEIVWEDKREGGGAVGEGKAGNGWKGAVLGSGVDPT